jgi:hypothetical protein
MGNRLPIPRRRCGWRSLKSNSVQRCPRLGATDGGRCHWKLVEKTAKPPLPDDRGSVRTPIRSRGVASGWRSS